MDNLIQNIFKIIIMIIGVIITLFSFMLLDKAYDNKKIIYKILLYILGFIVLVISVAIPWYFLIVKGD